jgi:hypothetical protein
MSDTSIIAAALIAQVSIVAIMAVASLLVSVGERDRTGALSYFVLFVALVTIVPLMFTRGYSATWGPLLGLGSDQGLQRSMSMLILFLVDIFAVHALVWLTGGSRQSPYQAIYFLLPALAIFLREPPTHLLWYLLLVTVSYTYLMFGRAAQDYRGDVLVDRIACWFTAVACFVLATYIGYLTRPL